MEKVYEVEVYETYCKKVKVVAQDEQEACDLASDEEINMTGDDYVSDTTQYGNVIETDDKPKEIKRINKLWRHHFESLRDDEELTSLIDMLGGKIELVRKIMYGIADSELLEIYDDLEL